MRSPFSRRRPFEREPGAEVNDELAFHLERRVAEYVAQGMTPEAARQAALAKFGDLPGVQSECTRLLQEDRTAAHRRDWIGDLRQDVHYGLRSLRRAPVFSLLAVVTLALGIGANAAVFGVVKSVLLDALPYAGADRVVRLFGQRIDPVMDRAPLSVGTIRDLRERQRSFESLASFESQARDAVFSAGAGSSARAIKVAWTEPGLFRTLGVAAARGRLLRDDDIPADTVRQVVISHAAWQQLTGGDERVIGGEVRINGIPRTVVGVLPRDFVGPVGDAEFYFPMSLDPMLRDPARVYMRQNWGVVARLRPGVMPAEAAREVAALGDDIAREQPRSNTGTRIVAMPIREAMVGDTRTPLLVLMASAALVLVITCANLAGALLSRTLSRRKEFAVRAALGAGRGRLVRQLLTESTILAALGGAAGVLLAVVALRLLRGLAHAMLPPYADLALDGGALAVTALVAVATGLAFGIVPALSVGRSNMQGMLREEGRGASESRRARHLRGVLVAGQIALCVSLLAGAGLLARSLWAMMASPLGFAPEGLLAATVQLPPGPRYDGPGRVRFILELEERLRALPGVTGVGTAGDLPTRVGGRNGVSPEGMPAPAAGEALPLALHNTVSDDYFRTLGMPLRSGRTFGPQDHAEVPIVLVISEGMARRFWPGQDAVGKRIRLGPDPSEPWMTVIGVVGDVANDAAKLQPDLATYMSMRQQPYNGPYFLIRTKGDPAPLTAAVRRELAAIDPGVPLREVRPMPELLAEGLAGRRLPVMLMTAFGALALLLASVGVYALFASMAAAREREFGVRIALGSTPLRIASLVLRQGGMWMALGLAGGAVGIVLVARLLSGLLHGIAPFDPVTLAVAVTLLLLCALVAVLGPVRRATRVDPIGVLR